MSTVGRAGVFPLDTVSGSCRRGIGIVIEAHDHNRAMARWMWSTAVALSSAVLLAGCTNGTMQDSSVRLASSSPSAGAQLRTITSADVTMPQLPPGDELSSVGPMRIVSLASGVGETLAALGADRRVVGRDETSDVPAIAEAPIVTKAHAVSAERVLALKPDLVLVDASTSPPEALDQIRAAGVQVVEVPEAWTLADIGPRTAAVAVAIGALKEAADRVSAEASGRSFASSNGPRVAFLYLRGTAAVYLIGGKGSGADALIEAAGGTDVGAAAGLDPFVPLTPEALVNLRPDVILVMTKGLASVGGLDGLVALPGVAQTPAGKSGRVIAVDDTLLLSFGPRTGRLIESLHAALDESR